MYLDVVHMKAFYDQPLGRMVRPVISARLRNIWTSVSSDRVVGVGYAIPYLRPFYADCERMMALMPAAQGVVHWPADGPNVATLVVEDAWPLPDQSIDKIVAVHGLEMADNPRAFLREAWRVLVPGGRLLVVVPSRRGLWARVERTPFGYGRPFSRMQLTDLLNQAMLSPKTWSEALQFVPSSRRFWLRYAPTWERIGRRFWPAFAGVLIVEAEKQLVQGVKATEAVRPKAVFRPVFAPQAAPRSNRDQAI